MSVDSPDGAAMVSAVMWMSEGVVNAGDDNEKPGDGCKNTPEKNLSWCMLAVT
jgi:hypothetical protein